MTTLGLDYASIDGNNTPNFNAAKQAGARFAILRAVYGRGGPSGGAYLDPIWTRDKDRVVAAGIKRGAYLFLCYPQKEASIVTPTPEDQADAFIGYVELVSYHDLVPFVDVEEASILAPADYYDWTLRAVKRLESHYGTWPGFYSSARVWHENVGDHVAGEMINCPPWIAKPWPEPVDSPIDLTGAPSYQPACIPEFGSNNCWIYQFQGDATGWPGFNKTVDGDRFQTIARGATGASVAWMQQRLKITADGAFGPQTEAAVKAMQTQYGLVADGIVGVNTFAVLGWLNPPAAA